MKMIALNSALAGIAIVLALAGFFADDTSKTLSAGISEDPVSINVTVVATNLDVPWEITWGPDSWVWFTEQKGLIRKANPLTGEVKTVLSIPDVHMKRAVGLLGLVFHPDIERFPYLFVDYSYIEDSKMFLKLVRYDYYSGTVTNPVVLLDRIPATETHNGSRLVLDPQGKILMTTGDIDKGRLSQDLRSLNGKILRLNIDGTVPDDNPFPGSLVWSYGHRNAQGLVYGANGKLYSAEHGDVTDDEVNLIRKGGNYGWPFIEGFCDADEEEVPCTQLSGVQPLKVWTPTIAVAGIDYYGSPGIPQWKNSILVTSLKDASFRILKLSSDGEAIVEEEIYISKKLGRLRDLCVSPKGDIFISTSNMDWNKTAGPGFPRRDDDRIIKLSPLRHGEDVLTIDQYDSSITVASTEGERIYNQYCISCHKSEGQGLSEIFPPLRNSPVVKGNVPKLISVLVNGIDTDDYEQAMPNFSFLKDQQIADVITFVRNSFGRKTGTITVEDIERVRQGK